MVGLPSARIRRGLDAVSAGGSFQLELDLIATALGNFSVGQCDDGTGNLVPCAGGVASLTAGQIPFEFNFLSISWSPSAQEVPVPSTMVLSILGLMGIGIFARRKS
jgi:hypothetical protein